MKGIGGEKTPIAFIESFLCNKEKGFQAALNSIHRIAGQRRLL